MVTVPGPWTPSQSGTVKEPGPEKLLVSWYSGNREDGGTKEEDMPLQVKLPVTWATHHLLTSQL